jgi:ABC-type phosphate/phosphonate transport system substrate-binding protein
VTAFIANARMYAVTPEAEAAWRNLLARILEAAGVSCVYEAYPAPQPLEKLWARGDLGCVLMCGFPIATGLAEIVPIAAPIPSMPWAGGRAVYRSDLIVRDDSPFETLADTFGHRLGWTIEHSHSGFNALRHHLLGFRTADRPNLFGEVKGHLVTARGILDAVKSGDIDVGPLDAYWHGLMRHHRPDLVEAVRVIDTTALAPIPAFVAAPRMGPEAVSRMKEAFAAAGAEPWFKPFGKALCLYGFEPVEQGDYAATLDRDRRAKAAGYPVPA